MTFRPGLLPLLLLALLILPIGLASAAPQDEAMDDELVQEFLRFFHPRRTVRERIEAIYVLKKNNTVTATRALVQAFDDKDLQVRRAAIDTIGTFTRDPASVQFLIENYVINKKEKKEQRIVSAVECLGLMGDVTAADHLLELFKRAKTWDLKRCIGEALGRMKAEQGLPALGMLIDDSDPTLRVVALDALGLINMPDAPVDEIEEGSDEKPRLVKDVVMKALADKEWQVRAAAIESVRLLRFKEAVQALIDRLREEEGRLRGDVYLVLKELTFSQYEDDPDMWQKYWDRAKDRFEMPDLAKVMEERKRRKASGTRYANASASFAGIPTKSRNIIFIIDVSGSMETQVVEIERFREGGRDYNSFQRLEIVKKELADTIDGFDENVNFNIQAFATNIKWWKKRLVRANILNKNSAKEWVSRLKPIGGASAGFRARAGLKANTLQEGKTNTYGALMAGLGAPEDPNEEISKKTFKEKVDTIYFLSDGQPTEGKIVDVAEIREMVRRVNQVRKVIIHAIAIGDFQKNFMRSLAEQNGGVYVDLGK